MIRKFGRCKRSSDSRSSDINAGAGAGARKADSQWEIDDISFSFYPSTVYERPPPPTTLIYYIDGFSPVGGDAMDHLSKDDHAPYQVHYRNIYNHSHMEVGETILADVTRLKPLFDKMVYVVSLYCQKKNPHLIYHPAQDEQAITRNEYLGVIHAMAPEANPLIGLFVETERFNENAVTTSAEDKTSKNIRRLAEEAQNILVMKDYTSVETAKTAIKAYLTTLDAAFDMTRDDDVGKFLRKISSSSSSW